MWKIFPAIEYLSNILQFTQCLISSLLDILKTKLNHTSQATFNKLPVHGEISEEHVQNPLKSTVQLFHFHRQTDVNRKNNRHF
jgi:hypothetical protein